jgi:Tfp pilus assembly protein PilV
MSKFLLTVCAFGLFFSSALAEEKSLEQLDRERSRIWGAEGLQSLQFARTVPSGTNQRIEFVFALNPDCTASGDINVRVTNTNWNVEQTKYERSDQPSHA